MVYTKRIIHGLIGRFLKLPLKLKIIIPVIVLLIVSAIVYQALFNNKKGYTLGKVSRQPITEMITESGTVTTASKVSIYSPTNGLVKEVFVANGDKVKENQKLFSVKSTASSQEKAAALAAYRAAQSALEVAENNRRSTQTTVDRVYDDLQGHSRDESFTQKETRTAAEVANDSAYSALLSAGAQLESAKANYLATQNSVVTAPVDGEISNLSVVPNSNVSVNNILSPTSSVLVIGSSGPTEVTVAIGESDINKIKAGQKVGVSLDAVDEKTYEGIVKRVDSYGNIVQGVVKYNVYIEIINTDDRVKPGMTVDVDIVTNELNDVLAVPNSAVKPYQKGRAVRILNKSGEIEYIPVKIGVRGKEFTQITGGLEEGREIIVSLVGDSKAKKNSLF